MWKVGDIAPVSVLGVDGYPVTRARAEEAAAQIRSAIEVRPHPQDASLDGCEPPERSSRRSPAPAYMPLPPGFVPVTASASTAAQATT